MDKCKIIIRDGLQMIVHPNGQEIPRLISTRVYQNLAYPPSVEVELYTDDRIDGAVKFIDERFRTVDTQSLFTMPNGDPIPGIDEFTITKISGDVGKYRFLIACEF